MMQIIIGIFAIASLLILINVQETEFNKEYKKCEEIDWNEYYAHN